MQLTYDLEARDFGEAQAAATRLACKGWQPYAFVLGVVPWIFIGFGAAAAFRALYRDPNWLVSPVLVVAGSFALAFLAKDFLSVQLRILFQRSQQRLLEPYPVRQTLTLSDDGLAVESRLGTSMLPWRSIRMVEHSNGYVLVALSSGNVLAVPPSAFTSPEGRVQFEEALRRGASS